MKKQKILFACCFCGRSGQLPKVEIIIYKKQTFWAHKLCLIRKMHDTIKGEVE